MNPDKKPRTDSLLDRLPESRVMELRDGLLSGWGHEECRSWLATECGVIIKSGSTLNTFYKRHCAPVISERRKLAAVKSEIYVKESGRTDWDAATAELVSQVTFEMLDGQRTDPAIAEKFVKLVLKKDAQDQSRNKARELSRTKIAAGMDALFAEIKGNRKAEQLFQQLREAVAKA